MSFTILIQQLTVSNRVHNVSNAEQLNRQRRVAEYFSKTGPRSEEHSFSVTLSEQILHVQRWDKRPITDGWIKEGNYWELPSMGWEEKVVWATTFSSCTSSILFVKEKRQERTKMQNITSANRLFFSYPVIYNKSVSQTKACSQFTAHKAKPYFDFDQLCPLNWCVVAFWIITCTFHHI